MVEQAVQDFLSNESGGKEKLDALNSLLEIVTTDGFALPSRSHSVFHDVILSLVSAVAAPSQSVRVMGLRVTRSLLKTSASNTILEALLERNIAYFLSGCLERSKQVTGERMQALKLVSQLANASPLLMPRVVAQSIMAIAKQTDDPLSILCVEILAQLAMGNPGLVGSVGGMNFLFHEIVHMENYHENRQAALVAVATFLCNDAPTRRHLDLHNMGVIVEPFTDSYTGADLRKKKWTTARTAITYFLRSWTGLICLASTPLGLASLVNALSLQDLNLNDRVLDCFFMIFHLPLPKVTDAGFNRAKAVPDLSVLGKDPLPYERHSLLGNYRAVLLVVFHHFQLVENLIKLCRRMNVRSIVEEGVASRTIARKATLLVAELLHLSNTLLPTSLCAKLQGLPDLMRDAITFTLDPHLRSLAGSTIGDLEKLALIQRANASRDTSKLDYFDEVKKNFDWTMDESTVKHKLNESVLLKKDFSQWNWEIISEMIEGPLSNPVHYNTPLATRFIKKILSFYRPSNKAFCNLPASGNEKYARIGCELIALILKHNNENILNENPLFAQISEMLRDVYETDKKGSLGEMLSEEHLLRTMTPGYFQMLGTLSETKQGVEVMHKHKIFNHLVPCAILPGRDGLCNMIIENLDYNQPGPSRVLLAKSLGAQSRVVRYLSTKRLQHLMRSGVSDFSEWGIRFLVQKLSDEDQKVSSFALSILEEACYDTNHLESLITKRAFETLQGMGKSGKDLLLRFLSRTSGFNYLSSTIFVRNELVFWKARGYVNYVERVELALADAFNSAVWRKEYHEVPIPVHLYGELVQTKEGIKLLEQNGDFKEFTSLLCSPSSTSLQKRGALWVLGHIGRTKMGYKEIFPKYSVLKLILHVARTCSCLSVRGTCFYVLGLICTTRSAANALHSMGWESNREALICVPSSLEACGVFNIKESETNPAWPGHCPTLETPQYGDARDQLIKEFTNLSNNLTFDKSAKAIKTLKAEHPEAFQDPEVQMHVFRLMENYSYSLPPRRYFQQIFSVFWSTERIKNLPSYSLPQWTLPKEEFATIDVFQPSSTWSIPDTNKKSNRRLKTASSRRESTASFMKGSGDHSESESTDSEKTSGKSKRRDGPVPVAAVRTKSTPSPSSSTIPLRNKGSQDSDNSSNDSSEKEGRTRPIPPKRLSRCERGIEGRASTTTFTSAVPSATATRRLSRPPPPPRPLKDPEQS